MLNDPDEQHGKRADDESTEAALGIVRGVDLVADVVDEHSVTSRQCGLRVT